MHEENHHGCLSLIRAMVTVQRYLENPAPHREAMNISSRRYSQIRNKKRGSENANKNDS